MSKAVVVGLAALALTACASIPEVEYHYFPAKATTSVTVTQTIDCNHDKSQFNFFHTPTVLTTYSSDPLKPHVLRTKDLQTSFADGAVKLDWFEDGRLKSVNQSSTGQGENIAKAALTFLAPVLGGGATPTAADCAGLAALGGGKPLTIVYEKAVEYSTRPKRTADTETDQVFLLQAAPNSKTTFDSVKALLKTNLPGLDFRVLSWEDTQPLVQTGAGSSDAVPLTLNKAVFAHVEVRVSKNTFWSGKVVVPTVDVYTLPIPRPKLFGTQTFALTLNEAGGITSMGYTSVSGTAGAFNALSQLSATISPSESAKANAMKAEADLIAQTQRLANCQASPADCK